MGVSCSNASRFTREERFLDIHRIGSWFGPKANVDGVKKVKRGIRTQVPRPSHPWPDWAPWFCLIKKNFRTSVERSGNGSFSWGLRFHPNL
jgi:hypothetical protein